MEIGEAVGRYEQAAALKLLPDEKRRQDVVSAQHRDFDGLAAERIAEAVLARCGK